MAEIFSHIKENQFEFDWVGSTKANGEIMTNIHTSKPHHIKKGDIVKVEVKNGNGINGGIHKVERVGTKKRTSMNEIIVINEKPQYKSFANGTITKLENFDFVDLKDMVNQEPEIIPDKLDINKNQGNLLKLGIVSAIGIYLLTKIK